MSDLQQMCDAASGWLRKGKLIAYHECLTDLVGRRLAIRFWKQTETGQRVSRLFVYTIQGIEVAYPTVVPDFIFAIAGPPIDGERPPSTISLGYLDPPNAWQWRIQTSHNKTATISQEDVAIG